MASSTSILFPALNLFDAKLELFATSPEYQSSMILSFGENHDYNELQPSFAQRGTSVLSLIEIVPLATLNGAYGGYSRDTNQIYLASEFINSATPSAIADVLLEEYGHYIDAKLNPVEAVGDEGEIFADLVQGNSIHSKAFTEDDTTTVTLNGKTITLEQGSPIIYVRQGATGANNGTSWANAYSSLATALTNAPTGSEIWVAQGTYRPTTTTDRDISFDLKNLVEVYGGFNGTETSRAQRNFTVNPTILSGDIGAPNDRSDNSYNVVTGNNLSASTVLDGFTITDGNNTLSTGDGAGFDLSNSSPILANLLVINNSTTGFSSEGGGGYIENGIPQLINVSFTGNTSQNGGALSLRSSSAILNNINFSGNSAGQRAGALYMVSSNPNITNSNFINNTANGSNADGGAIASQSSSPNLTNVRFLANSANDRGGAISTFRGSPNLFNVIFERNSSAFGGGIHFDGGFSSGNTPTLTNVVFDRNTSNNGGGIYNFQNNITANNVTFSNNTAATGSAIQSDSDRSQVVIINSILWNDQASTGNSIITNINSGRTIVNNSLVQGGYPNSNPTNPNLDANPLFINASIGNLRLQGLSLAINAGLNDAVNGISIDIAGNPRISAGTVDLGAYEFVLDPAQYGASYADLITGIGYNLPVLEAHYYNTGRFEGRSADNFDEFRYIASSYVTGGDLIGAFGLNGAAATQHYITNGYFEGRPLGSFIPSGYLNSYDDLYNVFGTNTPAATQHYIASGFGEGRNPNLFPSDRYIASYGDLIQVFSYNLEAGSNHYLFSGRGEGRQITFSPEAYLSRYGDLQQAFGNDLNAATQHYILRGYAEGRTWM